MRRVHAGIHETDDDPLAIEPQRPGVGRADEVEVPLDRRGRRARASAQYDDVVEVDPIDVLAPGKALDQRRPRIEREGVDGPEIAHVGTGAPHQPPPSAGV